MSNYVRVLTPEQAAAEDNQRMGCLAGLICCGLATLSYCHVVGPLNDPLTKVGAIACGVLALVAGYRLRTLVWAVIMLGILGYAGWRVVFWVMA